MLTGWQQVGGRWYYLSETHGDPPYGSMRTGWVQVGGKWYWLNEDGSMSADKVDLIDGTFYGFDSSVAMLSHSLSVKSS
jgi:glucan-binding YG repeat protein